jgi:hypothetical protein
LQCGNSTVAHIEKLLRLNLARIQVFAEEDFTGCLGIY